METGGAGHDRPTAEHKFEQAKHEHERGHEDRAEDLCKEALEFDPSFNQVRMFLVDLYMGQGEEHMAGRVLQDAIYTNREDQVAWAKLREIDPATAARLDRLGHIAPDPFIGGRAADAPDDAFDSLEDSGAGDDAATQWLSGQNSADVFADDDEDAPEGPERIPAAAGEAALESAEEQFEAEEESPGGTGVSPVSVQQKPTLPDTGETPVPPGAAPQPPVARPANQRGPAPWEYEQDRQYLARWLQEEIVQKITADIQELWSAYRQPLRPVIDKCAHLERSRHPDLVDGALRCCAVLGVEAPELMLFAERCMHPVPIQDDPARLAIPVGLIRSMQGGEAIFQIGRELEYIRSGYLAEWQAAELVAKRPTRLIGDIATQLTDLLHELVSSAEARITRDARPTLAKLAHAWQQRATLTADRAGLLCCGDVDAACRAIAKTTAASIEKASTTTVEGFLEQFKSHDPAQLAAIPPNETPDRSVNYAAYRIKMLRWWANTPEGKRLQTETAVA